MISFAIVCSLTSASKLEANRKRVGKRSKIFISPRKIVFIPEFLDSFRIRPSPLSPFSEFKKISSLQKINSFFRILGIFFVLGNFFSNFDFFSFFLNNFSQIPVIWINFSAFSIIFWLRDTEKKALKILLIQLGFTLLFLNLLNYGGFLILLGGNFYNAIFFLLLGSFLLFFNLWFPFFQNLQVSNRVLDQEVLFRHLKTFLLVVVFLQIIPKIIMLFSFDCTKLDIFSLPSVLKNWALFFQLTHFSFFLENFFKFHAIGDGIYIFFTLTFLYYFAFYLLREIESKNSYTNESFDNLGSNLINSKKLLLPNQIFLKTNGKFQNYIGNLLDQELDQEKFEMKRKSNSWAIKKKGINIPYYRVIWNNELPFSKQGLWYEIKKKN